MDCKCSKFFEKNSDWLLLVSRVLFGLMFALHGAAKFGIFSDKTITGFATTMSLPIWLAGIVAAIELIGGLLILLGLFIRPAALISAVVMLVAFVGYHMIGSGTINPLVNGAELAILYFAGMLFFLAYGGGKYSLEAKCCKMCKT